MVEYQDDELSRVFRALGDPTRRAMLQRLAQGERTVGELAEPFRMSLAGASKHVKVLERAGLVRRTVEGRTHRCHLDARQLAEAHAWLRRYERFWAEGLDALEALLKAEDEAASDRSDRSEEKGSAKGDHGDEGSLR
jgi:DNA-binding transcriptional ArsR family regulator